MNRINIIVGVAAVVIGAGWWYVDISNTNTQPLSIVPQEESQEVLEGEGASVAAASVAQTVAAETFGVPERNITVLSVRQRDWPNGCLGLENEDELCIQVITPGYEVNLGVSGSLVTYRTNIDGSVVREVE